MKRYNERVLYASKKLSRESMQRSKNTVNKFTHPSKKAAIIGSRIGIIVGIGLLITGFAGTVWSYIWGFWSFLAGVVTIVSNVINIKKYK